MSDLYGLVALLFSLSALSDPLNSAVHSMSFSLSKLIAACCLLICWNASHALTAAADDDLSSSSESTEVRYREYPPVGQSIIRLSINEKGKVTNVSLVEVAGGKEPDNLQAIKLRYMRLKFPPDGKRHIAELSYSFKLVDDKGLPLN